MKVLITRPTQQAQRLMKTLRGHHFEGICFPAIEIAAPTSLNALQQALMHLPSFDILIFVSPNAVNVFLQHASKLSVMQGVFAIGEGTANALLENNIKVTGYPQQANSKGLLDLPQLQSLPGKKIAIFAGEGGKTLLADTLSARGAKISMAYTHQRILPEYHLPFSWKADEIDISVCTSENGLRNFRTIIDHYGLTMLLAKPLLVITSAMQRLARQLGFKSGIILAKGASDIEILAALQLHELDEKQTDG